MNILHIFVALLLVIIVGCSSNKPNAVPWDKYGVTVIGDGVMNVTKVDFKNDMQVSNVLNQAQCNSAAALDNIKVLRVEKGKVHQYCISNRPWKHKVTIPVFQLRAGALIWVSEIWFSQELFDIPIKVDDSFYLLQQEEIGYELSDVAEWILQNSE